MNVHRVFVAVAIALTFSSAPSAQDRGRVIEETLVVSDPTVAAQGKALLGGAVEGFYIYGPYRARTWDGTVEKGTIRSFKPGVNIFAGYGDLSVNYVYRQGTESVDSHHNATDQVPKDYDHTRRFRTTENEMTLRWRLRDLDGSWYSPYVYAGFAYMTSNNTDTINTPGVLHATGTNVEESKTRMMTGLLGVGGIFPSDDKSGYRADVAVNYTLATWEREFDGATLTGSGFGGRVTGTYYRTFLQGWNVQAGARFDAIRAVPAIVRYRFGLFAMLGYTHRFLD